MRLEVGAVRVELVLVHAERAQLPRRAADPVVGRGQRVLARAVGNIGEAEVLVEFPGPVDGQVQQAAEVALAFGGRAQESLQKLRQQRAAGEADGDEPAIDQQRNIERYAGRRRHCPARVFGEGQRADLHAAQRSERCAPAQIRDAAQNADRQRANPLQGATQAVAEGEFSRAREANRADRDGEQQPMTESRVRPQDAPGASRLGAAARTPQRIAGGRCDAARGGSEIICGARIQHGAR